jgi:hypothetical protein
MNVYMRILLDHALVHEFSFEHDSVVYSETDCAICNSRNTLCDAIVILMRLVDYSV